MTFSNLRAHLPLVALLLGGSVFSFVACSSSDEPGPPPGQGTDGGDAASDASDGGVADASEVPDVFVDAAVPPVVCTVTPCAVEAASGADSVCVRLSDGTVRCWGSNGAGELGRGPGSGTSANSPAPVLGLNDATQITGSASAGGDVYCALRASGSAVCWGANAKGVLGRVKGDDVDVESSPTPAPVAGLTNPVAIFAGGMVSCATLAGSEIACWGSNEGAQFPGKPHDGAELYRTTSIALDAKSRQLGLTERGTVALTDNGLLSWGLGGELLGSDTSVLGRESSTDVSPPAKITLSYVSAIAGSGGRVCAIANGAVYCWGAGPTVGSDSVYPAPIGVGTASTAFAQTIAVGPRSSCATVSDGTAFCWGDNSRGQLGTGNFDLQPTPVRVQKLAGKAARMAVMETTTCAILSTGAVQCWGQNDKGQLGTGTADALPHLEPQNVVFTP